MAKAKTTTEEPLEKQLWKAADKLRKNIDAAEYKHIVQGLIFLKYISDAKNLHYANATFPGFSAGDWPMGSILHGNAKTTPRIRQEIQDADESLATLAARYSLNEKTVLKWTHADGIEDKKSGPATRRSVLTEIEQQAVCTVRRHLRLPLDDLHLVFKPRIPKLSRSNLHRCLQHHGLSRLPTGEDGRAPKRKASKAYPIGYLHVDITGLRTEQGKHYLFVAVDRATKYVYAELYGRMTAGNALLFLRNLEQNCVFKITHILTDNSAQFTYNLLAKHLRPKHAEHPFDSLCQQLGIEHRTTQFRHPWTNGQVEITNKTIKQATTKQFHCTTATELKTHLLTFLLYYLCPWVQPPATTESLKLQNPLASY